MFGLRILLVLLALTVSASLSGCYNEKSRAVLQCADEYARCTRNVDELCRTDDRYCDYEAPFSNRTEAIELCHRSYDDCFAVATSSRTPDRFNAPGVDGGS